MIRELDNWYEVTNGLYRYVVAANWTRIPERTSFFSREILLAEQPVFECLKAAEKDYKENL